MSLPHGTGSGDTQIRKMEERIREEEARMHRMILRGGPSQSGDDQLRGLRETLRQMKARRRPDWR
jgi:hypothetical protein